MLRVCWSKWKAEPISKAPLYSCGETVTVTTPSDSCLPVWVLSGNPSLHGSWAWPCDSLGPNGPNVKPTEVKHVLPHRGLDLSRRKMNSSGEATWRTDASQPAGPANHRPWLRPSGPPPPDLGVTPGETSKSPLANPSPSCRTVNKQWWF